MTALELLKYFCVTHDRIESATLRIDSASTPVIITIIVKLVVSSVILLRNVITLNCVKITSKRTMLCLYGV